MKGQKDTINTVTVDDLTGLPTKEQHKAEAIRILQEMCIGEKYAYVACDIVDFKLFNETYGYDYGNLALKHTAKTWLPQLGSKELLSRTTQDYFCMLLQYEEEYLLKERVMCMLESASAFPVDKEGNHHKAAFRCGVYLITAGDDINKIRSRADTARRSLEKCQSTSVTFYNEEVLAKEIEKRELEVDIRRAVEERELVVYFQPKFDIATEKIGGAEALIRWVHPKKGIVSPGDFVPLCEENGFICVVDFYVLEEVCRRMKQWEEAGKKLLKISVNFSRLHLYNPDFVEELVKIPKRYQLEPSMIEIELTESVAYHEIETLLDVMHKIKKAGFGLSMDDFGSGYSSLNLLREMPVDVLKLDKGFLDDCSGDDSTREKRIIAHVIAMAKDLGIIVLAEGVETEQQKEFLKESRCDIIQGYYYAKPMPTENFVTYLEQFSA